MKSLDTDTLQTRFCFFFIFFFKFDDPIHHSSSIYDRTKFNRMLNDKTMMMMIMMIIMSFMLLAAVASFNIQEVLEKKNDKIKTKNKKKIYRFFSAEISLDNNNIIIIIYLLIINHSTVTSTTTKMTMKEIFFWFYYLQQLYAKAIRMGCSFFLPSSSTIRLSFS